jgi:hypothetical protein
MSIESLLGQNPPATVLDQMQLGSIDPGGMPSTSFYGSRQTIGRPVPLNANRQLFWQVQYNVLADYEFLTLDSALRIDEGLLLADGRVFQIMSEGQFHYAMGSIPSHWRYAIKQYIQGKVTIPSAQGVTP